MVNDLLRQYGGTWVVSDRHGFFALLEFVAFGKLRPWTTHDTQCKANGGFTVRNTSGRQLLASPTEGKGAVRIITQASVRL
jgi:hypothetical protein